MADPFAPNNTPRLWVRYTSAGYNHEILFRGGQAATSSSMITMVEPILEQMKALIRTLDAFESARYSEKGSNISLPVEFEPVQGTGSNSGVTGDSESYYLDFIGRDQVFGNKVHWTLFTSSASAPTPGNNRVAPGASAACDAIIAALAAAAASTSESAKLTSIGLGRVVVYPYVNTGYNSYWQKRQRR